MHKFYLSNLQIHFDFHIKNKNTKQLISIKHQSLFGCLWSVLQAEATLKSVGCVATGGHINADGLCCFLGL